MQKNHKRDSVPRQSNLSITLFRIKRIRPYVEGIFMSIVVLSCIFTTSAAMDSDRSVLYIGDSNTELGFITGALKDILINEYGDFGTGYYPLSVNGNISAGRVWGYQGTMEGLDLDIDTTDWNLVDAIGLVYDGKYKETRNDPPNLSPSTHWVESRADGAAITAEFKGSSFDLYWGASENGGTFEITVNGATVQTVNTQGPVSTKRTTITDLDQSEKSTVVFTQKSGTVILHGIDIKKTVDDENHRAVVHTWANSGATALDFAIIDPDIFSSSLTLLNPTYVVIQLGTNDAIENMPEEEFRANLNTIVSRVKNTLPYPRILIASCNDIKFSEWEEYGGQYIETSYPTVAQETEAEYWNLNEWFGPWKQNKDAGLMQDKAHVNKKGGEAIATQLWQELQSRFGTIDIQHTIYGQAKSRTPRQISVTLMSLQKQYVPQKSINLLGRQRTNVIAPSIGIQNNEIPK